MPPALAVEAWLGPLDGVQDFELGTGAIEVKATVSSTGFPARIGSLEQLDDSIRQPLFVAGVRLRQVAAGRTLPDFVSSIRAMASSDPEARRMLSERMLRAGYFDAHADRYPRRFEIASIRVVEVGGGVPRLTHSRVPAGVLRATYDIDLDNSLGDNVGVEDALKKLGAL